MVPSLSTSLLNLVLWGIYPVWLIAGGLDWLCHRATRIETTSGSAESWLHVAQFFAIGALLITILIAPFGAVSLVTAVAAAFIHTVLSYIDVRYTLEHRRISSLEQHVHGFLDVLPWIACALWIVMNLPSDATGVNAWRLGTAGTLEVLGSYAVLAGAPIVNELRRTLRFRSPTQQG